MVSRGSFGIVQVVRAGSAEVHPCELGSAAVAGQLVTGDTRSIASLTRGRTLHDGCDDAAVPRVSADDR
jgi:hypothetical protein